MDEIFMVLGIVFAIVLLFGFGFGIGTYTCQEEAIIEGYFQYEDQYYIVQPGNIKFVTEG